jgi:AcrR family transcriptional regulator
VFDNGSEKITNKVSEKLAKHLSYKPEQILHGAMQVFLQHGYAGTSMDRVATKAGVSKHTIYNHFENKDGLFVALFEHLVLRHFTVEFGCEVPTESPDVVLRRLGTIFLERMDDPEYIAFWRLLIAESGRFPKLAELYTREVINHGAICLGKYLQSQADLSLRNPEMTAHIFFGSLASFVLWQEVLYGKRSMPVAPHDFIDHLVELVLHKH